MLARKVACTSATFLAKRITMLARKVALVHAHVDALMTGLTMFIAFWTK